MTKSNQTKKFALSAIFAAIAGYLAGILTAPKSGKETRGDIKDTASETRAETEKELKELHVELDKLVAKAKTSSAKLEGKAKQQLSAATDKADVAKSKANELLSAAREGKTKDQDLKKAIGEANNAIDHLKTFLKKP